MSLYFICLRCESYLTYGAEIARNSIMTELDNKLGTMEKAIYKAIDNRFQEKIDEIKAQTEETVARLSKAMDQKFKALENYCRNSIQSFEKILDDEKSQVLSLKTDLKSLNDRCGQDLVALKTSCSTVQNQMSTLTSEKRKETFVIRNFPERTNGFELIDSVLLAVARPLNLEQELMHVKHAYRIDKPRTDGKPRLILVKTTEKVARLFLSRCRLLKQAGRPLNSVFVQENLSPEENKKLFELRKRAYEHRTQNPGEVAYVYNKKLIINGAVVDEVSKNF